MQHPKLQLYKDEAGEYRYRLTDRLGRDLLISPQGFTSKLFCLSAMEFIKAHAPYDNCYGRKITSDRKYYFTVRDSSGLTLGVSCIFTDYFSRENSIAMVKSNAPFAGFEDLTEALNEEVLSTPSLAG